MDGDIDVYKHFAWLKRVSGRLLLCLGLSGDECGERHLGGVLWGEVFVQRSPVVAKFSMRF